MTRGRWIALAMGFAVVMAIGMLRFWAAPALIRKIQEGTISEPSLSRVTKIAVWLFDNPLTADRRTRATILLMHIAALIPEKRNEEMIPYAEKILDLDDGSAWAQARNAQALSRIVYAFLQVNKPERAIVAVNQLVKRLEERYGKNHPALVRPLSVAAEEFLNYSSAYEETKILAERAVAISVKHGGPYDPAQLSPLQVLSRIAFLKKDLEEALRVTEKLRELEKRLGSRDAMTDLVDLYLLRRLAEEKGDEEKAFELSTQLVQRATELAAAEKIDMAAALFHAGPAVTFVRKLGRHGDAIAWTRQIAALPGFDTKAPAQGRLFCYLALAEDYVDTARYAEAREHLSKAVALSANLAEPAARSFVRRLQRLESLCRERGRAQLAEEIHAHLLQVQKETKLDAQMTSATKDVAPVLYGFPYPMRKNSR